MYKIKKVISKILVAIFIFTQVIIAVPMTGYATNKNTVTKTKYEDRQKTEIIVKYKDMGKSDSICSSIKDKMKLSKLDTKKRFARQKIDVLEIDKTNDISKVIRELKKNSYIEYAQPNYLLDAAAVPSDDKFPQQWGLSNNGQEIEGKNARNGVDINATTAWDITQGSDNVIVGLLDTGIDVNHQDLSSSIYINSGEIPGNGIDDDENGYIDDLKGWDFANDDASVFDSSEIDFHGTGVAGIIAAQNNNGGIAGIAPNVKILPLKFINGSTGYTCDAIEAIEYAMTMGVKIVNCSFAGTDNNMALKDAMQNSGILFICAAGNRGGDVADLPVYPSCFGLPNIISVASIDTMGTIARFSSYGSVIEVAAPGSNILSTTPDNSYDYFSGTSVSAAFVTGIAALLKSYLPDLSNGELKSRIGNNVRLCTALQGMLATEGRVDAYASLTNTPQALDEYNGPGAGDDTLLNNGEGDEDTWYTQEQLARIKEKLHYGESGVNPASGNFSFTCTDMSVPAPGFQINISRTYNSRDEKIKPMGRGWSFGFEGSATGTDLVEVKLPDGSSHRFRRDGSYYLAEDTRASFVKNGDGTSVLTTKDQYTYGFSTNGLLSWMKDKNGNVVTISHDAEGKITEIMDAVGRNFTVLYNGQGLIDNIKDPENRQVFYEYDASNRLIKVKDPMNGYMNYGYDNDGYLSSIKDHYLKPVESIDYNHNSGDSQHKVVQVSNSLGAVYSYSYDMTNRKTTVTDTNQRKWTYWFDTSMYTIRIQDPEGMSEYMEYYYNGKNNYGDMKSRTDRNGNKTRYDIDSRGNVTKITNPDLSFRLSEYDEKNNLISETDELGRHTFYIYDSQKTNLVKKVQPLNGMDGYVEGVSNPAGYSITSYGYYTKSEAQSMFGCNAAGLLFYMIDPADNRTEYTYNSRGDIKSVKDPAGYTTSYEYNNIGWKTAEITPKGYRTEFSYDGNGLPVMTKPAGGETTRTVYDYVGHKIKEISPNQYNQEFDIDTMTYNADHGTRYTYYDSGKVETVTDANEKTTSYVYDIYGNIIKETKPDGTVYTYTYDNLDRLIKTCFKENADAQEILLNEYSYGILYDGCTQKTEIEYLNEIENAITVTIFDYAGREVEKQYADGTRTKLQYNADGSVNTSTAANGSITTFKYEGLGRLSEQWSPLNVTFGNTYYSYSAYSYDKAGKKLQESTGKEPVSLNALPVSFTVKNYTYYPNGKIESSTDNEGRKTVYTYDADGNTQKVETYYTAADKNVTEYEYNHLEKVINQKVHVRKGDIAENDFNDNSEVILLTSYTYDKNGNIKTVKTPDNVTTMFEYDVLDRQTSSSQPGKDEYGNDATITTSKTYDWAGNVLSSTDENNNKTSYAYNKRGFLEKVINPLNGVTAYWYDYRGRKTAEVSPESYSESKTLAEMDRTEYVYDTMDRVKAQILKYSEKKYNDASKTWDNTWVDVVSKAYKYDNSGNVVKELDALGYESGSGSIMDEKISSGYGIETSYNLAGKPVTMLDPVSKERGLAFTVRLQYDGLGRKISETDAKGTVHSFTYDGLGNILSTTVNSQIVKTMGYDLAGRQTFTTDGKGNTTTYEYNALNKVKKIVFPGDDTIPSSFAVSQYDVMGNLAMQQASTGKTSLYAYDSQNRLLSQTEQDQNGSSSITTAVKYDKAGNSRFETDANGNVMETVFNALNRPIASKVTVNGVQKTTSYEYDANGNQTTVTDWLGNTSTNIYDAINRLIEKKDAYLISIQKLEYNHNNVQTKSFDAYDNETGYSYDRNNRLLLTTDPEGHTSSQSYDNTGNIETKTDGRGNVTTYSYDIFNRLISVLNARSELTGYTYDLNGNMLTQTDAKNNISAFEYNTANKLKKRTDPGGAGNPAKTETYTYYADGSLMSKTDRNGKTTQYTYDIHGRMLSQYIESNTISYTYDSSGNQRTMTDTTGTTTRDYDEENRVTLKTVPGFGTTEFTYDTVQGQQPGCYAETSTDLKGNATTKVYDRVGRLFSVTAGGQTTTYTYYDNGNRKTVLYPDGSSEEYTYFNDNLVKTLVNKKADGSIIDSYSYTYDSANNQSSKVDQKGTTYYTYDTLNRMDSVAEPGGKYTIYSFDKAGNRVGESITLNEITVATTYKYNEQNRLLSTETCTGQETEKANYVYDNNGNTISSTKTTTKLAVQGSTPNFILEKITQSNTDSVTLFTYDVWNQLVKTVEGGKTSSYVYNGEGCRVEKTVDGQITKYLYEADKVILETDGLGNQTAWNVYGINLVSRKDGNDMLYYMYNGHGDVTALIDNTGTVQATYYYDAFGNITENTGAVNNPIRYAGYQYDSETGLYYLNSRYYDSKIARFLSEDTYRGRASDPLSLNLYTYCANNPIKYKDPSGHVMVGDDKLSGDVQAALMDLTAQWNAAKTKAEKDRIHDLANDYRSGAVKPTNQITASDLQSDISSVLNDSKTSQLAKDIINKSLLGTFNSAPEVAKNSIVSGINNTIQGNRDQVIQAVSMLDTLSVTANSLSTIQNQASTFGSFTSSFTTFTNYAQSKAYGQMVGIESLLLSNNVVQGNDLLTTALVNAMSNGIQLDTRMVEELKKALLSVDSYNEIYNVEKDAKIRQATSDLIDAIPGVSTVKAAIEGISGQNMFTNNGLNGWQRGLSIVLTALDLKSMKSLKSTWSAMDNVPESLLKGQADNYVYYGMKDGDRTYVGITNNVERRAAQHGTRFDRLDVINDGEKLTRNQARAIEQSLIELNPQFTNKINSISKVNPIYQDATQWGRQWLYEQGFIK